MVAFFASILTFFSGFGLGTILLPVFAVFFPIELAIALTGIVHFCNNIFKLFLVGKSAHLKTLLYFGIPAVIFAFIGAYLLVNITDLPSWYTYTLFERTLEITPVKLIIAIILIIFAIIELLPFFDRLVFKKKHLPFGGMLSGFFGGLSGHQGALRRPSRRLRDGAARVVPRGPRATAHAARRRRLRLRRGLYDVWRYRRQVLDLQG